VAGGKEQETRKIHIKLPSDLHRRLRIECAAEDTTIQQYVSRLVEKALCAKSVIDRGGAARE